MGLNEDAVDLFKVHDAGLVADGFDERTQAQVAGAAQEAFAGADDEGQGFGGEGVVTQTGAIQLIENKGFVKGSVNSNVVLTHNGAVADGTKTYLTHLLCWRGVVKKA